MDVFFAIDPLADIYPWYTPYSFSGNKVIAHRELEGLEGLEQYFTITTGKVDLMQIGEYDNPKIKKYTSRELAQKSLDEVKAKLKLINIIREAQKNTNDFNENLRNPKQDNAPAFAISKTSLREGNEKELADEIFPTINENIKGSLGLSIGVKGQNQKVKSGELFNIDINNDNNEDNKEPGNIVFYVEVLKTEDNTSDILFLGGGIIEIQKVVVAKLKNEEKSRIFTITEKTFSLSVMFGSIDIRLITINGREVTKQTRKGLNLDKKIKGGKLLKKFDIDIGGGVDLKTDYKEHE